MTLLTRTGLRINRCCSITDFPFFKMATVRYLGFLKVGNFNFRSDISLRNMTGWRISLASVRWILIFAVLERRLLERRENEASFCFYNVLMFYSGVIQCFAAIVNHLIPFEFYICWLLWWLIYLSWEMMLWLRVSVNCIRYSQFIIHVSECIEYNRSPRNMKQWRYCTNQLHYASPLTIYLLFYL